MLEDLKTDQELIKRAVQKVVPNALFTIAKNKGEFLEKIKWVKPDVILADYTLPDYNGLEALLYVKEHLPMVPFIFVTGSLNDEIKAANAIMKGASSYILKDNLGALTETLEEIIIDSEAKIAVMQEKEKKRNRNKMLLQKLQVMLDQTSPFPEKDTIEGVLNEILEVSQ